MQVNKANVEVIAAILWDCGKRKLTNHHARAAENKKMFECCACNIVI